MKAWRNAAVRLVAATATAAALAALALALVPSERPGVLVPAYFYPSRAGLAAWNQLARDANAIRLEAILNPASGPGRAQDPGYVKVITRLRRAGGRVLGYVSTDYSRRDLETVKEDILKYRDLYAVDGFFIDEMASTEAAIPYYKAIYQFVRGLSAALKVVGNPGIAQTHEGYLETADALVVFEGSYADYVRHNPTRDAPCISRYPPERFVHIIYRVPSRTRMMLALGEAKRKHAGAIFVTDRGMPNPYDALPEYWLSELDALRNAALSPE
jgi:hypothetical protein